jgi:hypothetical protein
MRFAIALILSLFLLSSCATMESAWDTTTGWVTGEDSDSSKGSGKE